jgi:hypothetical protein
MCIQKLFPAGLVAAALAVLVAASAHALTMDNTNFVTFSTPIALPGVTLPAGTYLFRTPSETDKNIVQVLNRAANKSYYMGITRPIQRTRPGSALVVTMGEAPVGQVRPIEAWFPIGTRDGHSFIYGR